MASLFIKRSNLPLHKRSETYHRYKMALSTERLPALILDIEAFDKNCKTLVQNGGEHRPIRVATKSLRCIKAIQRILNTNPSFKGLMAYSAGEAAFLASQGFNDILIGYPTMDASDLRACMPHIKANKKIRFMICNFLQAERLNQIAQESQLTADYCIDLNHAMVLPGLFFGVRRSPITNTAQLEALITKIAALTHLRFCGFMGYEAQIAGVKDNESNQYIKNQMIRLLKKRSTRLIAKQRQEVLDWSKHHNLSVEIFNGGGTGSLQVACHDHSLTELTAGSGFFAPKLFDHYEHLKLEPALMFASPVTRQHDDHWFTCHGAGYIASGSTGVDRLPTAWLPEGLTLSPLEGAGEVQTPVKAPHGIALNIGDPVFFRHAKAGEVCEHFKEILVIKDNAIIDRWPTYRDMGQCFL